MTDTFELSMAEVVERPDNVQVWQRHGPYLQKIGSHVEKMHLIYRGINMCKDLYRL